MAQVDLLLLFIPPRPWDAFPPSSPCRPILTHQRHTKHQAGCAPFHLPWGQGWGRGVLQPPCVAGRLVGTSWGCQRLHLPLAGGAEQGRRAACQARRGQDETLSMMPLIWHPREPARAQAGRSRQGSRQAACTEAVRQYPGCPLPGAGAEADRIITAAIWAHRLVPLPFAFCIMDRL